MSAIIFAIFDPGSDTAGMGMRRAEPIDGTGMPDPAATAPWTPGERGFDSISFMFRYGHGAERRKFGI